MFVCCILHEISRDDSQVIPEDGMSSAKPSETHRQSDAMVVQRAFSTARKVCKSQYCALLVQFSRIGPIFYIEIEIMTF